MNRQEHSCCSQPRTPLRSHRTTFSITTEPTSVSSTIRSVSGTSAPNETSVNEGSNSKPHQRAHVGDQNVSTLLYERKQHSLTR